jgi:predicted RND superfamily exporter protein
MTPQPPWKTAWWPRLSAPGRALMGRLPHPTRYLTAAWRARRVPTRRTAALLVVGVVLSVGLIGGISRIQVDTGPTSFLASGDPAVAVMEQKARDFGGDPIVVLLHSPRARALLTNHDQLLGLLKLEGTLERLPDVAVVYGPATVVNQLASAAQDMLASIAGRRDGVRIAAEQQAAREGKTPAEAELAGEDAVRQLVERYAPLMVRGLPVGLPTLSNPRFAGAVIYDNNGAPRPQWRFIVPDINTVALLVRPRENLDELGAAHLVTAIRTAVEQAALPTAGVTISGIPVVTAQLAGQIIKEIPWISGLVALVVLLRFLLLPSPGPRRQRLWPLAAAALGSAATFAVFGWIERPLSFGAVILLPLLLGIGSSFPLYLATLGDRRPVLVVALASSVAFGALGLSPLPFIRELGISLALGIALTVLAATVLLHHPRQSGAQGSSGPPLEPAPPAGIPRVGGKVSRRQGVSRIGAFVVAAAVAAGGWSALSRLDVESDPQQLAQGLPALTDAHTVEQVLGSSGEIGIVLRGPDVLTPAALSWAREAQAVVATNFGEHAQPVLGAPELFGFLGPDPTAAQITAALHLLPTYLSSAVVRPDRHAAVQVVGLRLQPIGTQTDMLDRLAAALPLPPPGYVAQVAGLPVAAGGAYQALLADRYLVNLAGIALAGLILAIGLRRRSDALRAIAAAALATGWGLALLHTFGLTLNPLTVGLGALVTVTGCEFLVLLAESHRQHRQWLSRSVLFACLTSAAGYLALAGSRLEMVRDFALILSGGVILSYLAALLILWLFPPGRARTPATNNLVAGTSVDPSEVHA